MLRVGQRPLAVGQRDLENAGALAEGGQKLRVADDGCRAAGFHALTSRGAVATTVPLASVT